MRRYAFWIVQAVLSAVAISLILFGNLWSGLIVLLAGYCLGGVIEK